MFESVLLILFFSLSISCTRSHIVWEAPKELHPVHGLYVKPSIDGTTGDLYVAATEDKGIKSQWLTDQPINFLAAASQHQQKSVPISLTSSLTKTTSPQDEVITNQKRAVITSPPVKYAYALPIPGVEGSFAPYPYAIPTSPPSEGSVIPTCPTDIHAQPYPFHYFYPHMMSAIANAMNTYKEGESNEEKTSIPPAPYWPQPYGYPYQYVILDPSGWTQSQTNPSPLPTQNSSEST